MNIRLETINDYLETENVVREAFWNHYSPGCYEHYLLHCIRNTPDFISDLNYVAVIDNKIVGSIVFMKGAIQTENKQVHTVLTLGPIAVHPTYQNKGIGAKLIAHTLQLAKNKSFKAVLLCGDPAYYSKHGFELAEHWDIRTADNKYADALQIAPLDPLYLEQNIRNKKGIYTESSSYNFEIADADVYDCNFDSKEKITGLPSQLRFNVLVNQNRDPESE